ncbi:suppressor of presenilin protein 4-like isoform X6 [Odontomachus brunneus]|uniref:suppressor of presenilin protein 4-like isoform X6 n=1 Tax=Odontomachus brunneus TaxID=486640 RepID=UPI0013F25F55|nr:suppressor of presenilin protein 4-like isoform X6 [Odontomachus brunneus]
MLPAAGKAERRSLRGSARLSSKMSGRQPRLRMLRPRPQQQQQQQQQQQGKSNSADASVTVEATSRRAEGNLKETEKLADARKRDARPADAKAEYTKASAMANEVDDGGGGGDDDDDDDDSYDGELMIVEDEPALDVDLKKDEEVIDLEPNANSYECKNCKPPKTLPSIKAYLEHLRRDHKHKGKSAHSPVENRCSACSYVALNVKDLEDHQRVHHLKRRFFRCAKCSYATHVRARYTKHVKYHYMPMVKCDACDFRTPYKWNLDRHTRNHGCAGAFQCRACNFTADIRQSLTVHEANHHDPPVGQVSRKSNNSFERKPRNSPKRYNQVGASDFQEGMRGLMASSIPDTSDSSVILVEDKKSALAGAECIALKCEEKGCQFITAWDSEMQRHLAECHKPVVSPKSKKPLPMLIPLGSPNSKPSNAVNSGPPTTLLKVPRVRVRPELAQIARDTELAKMYGNKEATNSKKDLNTAAGIFERKNASFFDKLKEKLTTATNNGIREIAIENLIWDEDRLEQRSVEETSSNEPPTKLLIINNKEHISTDQTSSSPITILSSTDSSRNDHHVNLSLRPPPPLRSATRSRGQSLLKNNPITMNMQSVGGTCGGAVTISSTTATDESKRTQWKCKRCNYRDSNKDNVLLHVRSHYESNDQEPTDPERNPFGCGDCPFSAPDAATLSLHRMHHRPNLDAIFKCYRCPYYVSTKAELLEHARLHGEELATVHQQSMDHQQLPDSKKYKKQHSLISDSGALQSKSEMPMEQMAQITARNKATSVLKSPKITGGPPPLLLDTRILSESPLVWVTRPDGTLNKMFKCRHCPYISLRRVEVQDHEVMHTPTEESVISCTDCTFTCSRKDIINAHTEMHNGCLGTVHCLVDETRPDNQQVNDLVNLLALKHPPAMGPEPDLRDSRLVHCCNKCPARFLCEKELRIHLRYHTTDLAYSCQWCSYAARQPSHLLAHQKAHSTEYQERTKYLLTMYNHSQRFPPPSTACVETETNQEDNNCGFNVAWIVVQLNENSSSSTSIGQRSGNQVFTCAKCPARYFKLDALEYHMTLHGSNNRFKCNDCDYSSKTAQNLVKHQVVHRRHNETNESASSPTSMPTSPVSISPLNMELPEPQYSLYARGNPNFVYPSYLRNGRIKEKRYKCHKCPSAFDKREQYRVHLTLHGSKQRYRCQTCDYSVQYYANYAQHRRKHLANAEAQASRRQFEDDRFSLDSDTDVERPPLRSSKSLRSSVSVYPIMTAVANDATNAATNAASNAASNAETSATTNVATNAATNNVALQPSNQDKQTLLLMQRKGIVQGADAVEIRCQYCPFCTLSTDKETMDAHKRRHGIERMTPPCPHCDYVPRKDENVGEHIRLHFNRLYKPESYVIVELLTLTMEKMPTNSRDEKQLRPKELLFKECADGKFLPLAESLHSNSLKSSPSSMKALKEKVMVDLNTGETKHLAA